MEHSALAKNTGFIGLGRHFSTAQQSVNAQTPGPVLNRKGPREPLNLLTETVHLLGTGEREKGKPKITDRVPCGPREPK